MKESEKPKRKKTKFKIIPTAVRKRNNNILEGYHIQFLEKGDVLELTINRTGIK